MPQKESYFSNLDSTEQRRILILEMLADIWGKLYLFHPNVVRKELQLNWEQVLLDTITQIASVNSTEEIIKVVNTHLFKPLQDPLFSIQKKEREILDTQSSELEVEVLNSSIGYIRISNPELVTKRNIFHQISEAYQKFEKPEFVIVDLRWHATETLADNAYIFLYLFLEDIRICPAQLKRQHHGWNETNTTSEYSQQWLFHQGEVMNPFGKMDGITQFHLREFDVSEITVLKVPTIFVVNNTSYFVLQSHLDAVGYQQHIGIIRERTGALIPPTMPEPSIYLDDIEVIGKYSVPVHYNDIIGYAPDFISENTLSNEELQEIGKKILKEKNVQTDSPPEASNLFMDSLQMHFPTAEVNQGATINREERLLGLFKIWIVIQYLYPNLNLASIDWGNALREWIPRVEAASSLSEYCDTLRQLVAFLNDGHVRVGYAALRPPLFGVPIQLTRIDGKVYVTKIVQELLQDREDDINIGDEVIVIDDKSITEIEEYLKLRISASTENACYMYMYGRREMILVGSYLSFLGEENSEMKFKIKRKGEIKEIALKRTALVMKHRFVKTDWSIRYENIGYIDLSGIPDENELDSVLIQMSDTDGLIFDLRGYPRFWITPILTRRLFDEPMAGTIFETPLKFSPDPLDKSISKCQLKILPHPEIQYLKPIVVLIDTHTQSMAEDLCMYLTHKKRVTFVGSTTAGSSGDISLIRLPHNGTMQFSGMVCKYYDGTDFQNIGIIPDVEIKPTIQGIIDGKDEVLERGLEVIRELIGTQS